MDFYGQARYQADLAEAVAGTLAVERLTGKRILVTGAAGMIGSFLVETLLKLVEAGADVEVYALGRDLSRLRQRFATAPQARLHYVAQDLSAPLRLDGATDLVIHAASNANPQSYATDPVGTITGNVAAATGLLDYCRSCDADFIYLSTGEVYGELEAVRPLTEDMAGFIDPMAVRSGYMLAKKLCENLCVAYGAQYGLTTKIVRLSHVFGPTFTARDNRVSAAFFADALKGQDIVLKSAGNQRRSYIYLSDAVSGILSVLTSGQAGTAYNVSRTANAISLSDFAQTIATAAGVARRHQRADSTDRAQRTPISYAVLSDAKLRALGWQPRVAVATGVARVLEILRNV